MVNRIGGESHLSQRETLPFVSHCFFIVDNCMFMSMCRAGWYQTTCHSIQEYVHGKNLVTSVYIIEQLGSNIKIMTKQLPSLYHQKHNSSNIRNEPHYVHIQLLFRSETLHLNLLTQPS